LGADILLGYQRNLGKPLHKMIRDTILLQLLSIYSLKRGVSVLHSDKTFYFDFVDVCVCCRSVTLQLLQQFGIFFGPLNQDGYTAAISE
jgi:hypothetical protein